MLPGIVVLLKRTGGSAVQKYLYMRLILFDTNKGEIVEQNFLLKLIRESIIYRENANFVLYPQSEEILEISKHHGVCLLIENVMQLDRKNRLINQVMRQKNLAIHYENMVHFEPISEELEKNKINYVITKGLFVALTAYGDEGKRHSEDLDVVICRKDYMKVKKILLSKGYVQGVYNPETNDIKEFTRQQELFYLNHTQQSAPFLKKTGNSLVPVVNLDLNFHIFWEENSNWNISKIISNSQIIEYKGFKLQTFRNEYVLLHTCLHAYYDLNSIYVLYKDYSYRLKYFVDIYGLVKNMNISWEKFKVICVKHKVERYVMYVLYYTSLVFMDKVILDSIGLPVPDEEFLNRFGLDNEGVFFWKENFLERLFCDDKEKLLNQYLGNQLKNNISKGQLLEGV